MVARLPIPSSGDNVIIEVAKKPFFSGRIILLLGLTTFVPYIAKESDLIDFLSRCHSKIIIVI